MIYLYKIGGSKNDTMAVTLMEKVDVFGINEDKLGKLILDIYDYVERINMIINSVDDIMNDIEQNFKVSDKNILIKKNLYFRDNLINIKNNILSYADELINVKKGYREISQDVASTVKEFMKDIDNYKEDIRR
jgi:hypothetical protein